MHGLGVNTDVNGRQQLEIQVGGEKVLEIGKPGTATASSGAATLHRRAGKITTEALTTTQNSLYTLTLTNNLIKAADLVFASVADGTNTQGTPMIETIKPAAGSVVIVLANKHATAEALNGTLVISFFSLNG